MVQHRNLSSHFWGLDDKDNTKEALIAILLAGIDGGISSLIQDIPVLISANNWQEYEDSFDRAYTAAAVAASEKYVSIAVDWINLPESVIVDVTRAVLEPLITGTASIVGRCNIDVVNNVLGILADSMATMRSAFEMN
jgi:hypothetical protein